MSRFFAIISNTFREGLAKKTIITLLVLNLVIIGFFLLALNVGGNALFLFGKQLRGLPDDVLRKFEAGITAFFYQVSIFIGIFAIAAFYPTMQEKGTIDLLLSRPMSRFNIFTAKFIGCMLVVFVVMAFLVLGTWGVFYFKTGMAHIEYLSTIPIFMLIFLAFMAFIAMVGIITRSTTLSAILGIFFPFIFSLIFFGLHESGILLGDKFWYGMFETLYWIFPKTPEITALNISIIAQEPLETAVDPAMIIWTTVGFAAFCYAAGAYFFQKRSY
jgi:ABC-type transport system involved in multi-copper enzyme maturation permease subunit